MSATPSQQPFGTFGGYRPSAIAQFPALAGWREITAGVVIPPRRSLIKTISGNSAAASTSTSFTFAWIQPGSAAPSGTLGNLDPEFDGNDALLIENLAFVLGSASVLNALTVTGVVLFINNNPAGGPTTTLAIIPLSPPTLNGIGVSPQQYYMPSAFVEAIQELQQLLNQNGGVPGLPPYVSQLQISIGLQVTNSNAGAVTFTITGYLQYRHFQGVSPS